MDNANRKPIGLTRKKKITKEMCKIDIFVLDN